MPSQESQKKTKLKEYSFDIDEYGDPKIYTNFEALGAILMRLFMLEPGTLQNNLDCGIGLISKWKYIQEDQKEAFINYATDQISDYINPYMSVNMSVEFLSGKNIMVIFLEIDTRTYQFYFNRDTLSLELIKNR